MSDEVWKDVVGYEGLYKVSSLGNIKSIDRTIYNKGRKNYQNIKGRIRKQVLHKNGYLQVMLSKDGNKLRLSHRIVAEAFISNKENKEQVNHINGIKTDNRIENLEWVTQEENMQHCFQSNLHPKNRIVLDLSTGIYFNSATEAAMCYNISRGRLTRYLLGIQKNKTNLQYV